MSTVAAPYRTIRLQPEGDFCWLILDRPEVLNALSAEVLGELLQALAQIAASPARAVVLRGEGRAFCSGADLKSLPSDVDLTEADSIGRHMNRWRDVIVGIRDLPLPSVAAVAGPAYGGGCNLALACDVVIAAQSARFCQSYIDRGVTADLGGSYLLPRLVGSGIARRLLLTGEVVSGDEAARIGLAAAVVPDSGLTAAARAMAETLATKDPDVLVAMRQLLDAGSEGSLRDALDREGVQVARILSTPGFRRKLDEYVGEN